MKLSRLLGCCLMRSPNWKNRRSAVSIHLTQPYPKEGTDGTNTGDFRQWNPCMGHLLVDLLAVALPVMVPGLLFPLDAAPEFRHILILRVSAPRFTRSVAFLVCHTSPFMASIDVDAIIIDR